MPDTDGPSSNTTSSPATDDRGTFLPLVFGGAFAVALGFFAAQIDSIERALGLAPPEDNLTSVVEAQSATIAEQAAQISELSARLDDVPVPEPLDLSGVETQISTAVSQLSDQQTALAALSDRIEELAKQPMTDSVSREAIAAYEAELNSLLSAVTDQQAAMKTTYEAEMKQLQDTVAEQRAQIESVLGDALAAESSAEERAKVALARASMTRIVAAVDSGAAFSDALADLKEASSAEVPEALASRSDSGVPTLAAVQADFPPAARAALSVARQEESATGGGGLGAFFQRQLGARSVTPQDGDDPDAVLSRADAAVKQGRIGDALTELDALPDVARTAMADWISQADARHAAVRAADELMTALSTN